MVLEPIKLATRINYHISVLVTCLIAVTKYLTEKVKEKGFGELTVLGCSPSRKRSHGNRILRQLVTQHPPSRSR